MEKELDKLIPKNPCSSHAKKKMGYMEWHIMAEKRKDKQIQCSICNRWFFKEEYYNLN